MPEFRSLLGARALAALGMSAIATVVAFQTWEVTGDPLGLGLLGLVQAIPALGLMLFSGHIADRHDRRSIILVTGSSLALGAVVLAVISMTRAGASFAGAVREPGPFPPGEGPSHARAVRHLARAMISSRAGARRTRPRTLVSPRP